ncbi:MAG: NAD-dependent dehydratase, partial [Chloroflexi bacterium]|nr:NAD-dependent dehydratase [Chloroflexota bacterium]
GVENYFSTPRAPIERMAQGGSLVLVEGSVSDQRTLERAFSAAAIDTVYHTAAQASADPAAAPPSYTEETNFRGPRMLLDACTSHAIPRIVFASSMRLYRTPLPRRLAEGSPLHPTDVVHLSQLYAEILLATHCRANVRCSGVAARLGIVHGIGPVMKHDPRFLAAPQRFCLQAINQERLSVATGPSTRLAFVHIEDAVEGLLRCRTLEGGTRQANVGNEVRTVASIAEAVRRAAGGRGIDVGIDYLGPARSHSKTEVTSVLSETGFTPLRRFEDSVAELLDFYARAATRMD